MLREALEKGDFQGLPLMTGTCRDEGLLILSHILKEPTRSQKKGFEMPVSCEGKKWLEFKKWIGICAQVLISQMQF